MAHPAMVFMARLHRDGGNANNVHYTDGTVTQADRWAVCHSRRTKLWRRSERGIAIPRCGQVMDSLRPITRRHRRYSTVRKTPGLTKGITILMIEN